MKYSTCKEINDIVKKLVKGDWAVKSTNRHIKIQNSQTNGVIVIPKSPSDRRAVLNWKQQVRHHGETV